MTSPPANRFEFWIRFVCGFIVFGAASVLIGIRFVDSTGVVPTLFACLAIALAMSFYVARIGDDGWRNLLNQLRWW